MNKIFSPFKQSRLLNGLFLSTIFLSFHYALIIYINSSFLSNFFSETQVSLLYIFGSILNVVLLLNASKIIEKTSLYRFTAFALMFEFLATVGLIVVRNPILAAIYFLIHLEAIALIYFNFDIFMESATKDEGKTGEIRAAYLTMANITIVLAPLVISFILVNNNYSLVYLFSALLLLPLYKLIKKLKTAKTGSIKHIRLVETILDYRKDRDLYNISMSGFLLQSFYAFMVIYTPIYLVKHIGFSWSEIGVMFTIMLLPFVFFELPVGELADRRYGEKEFLTIGFIIMGLCTLVMSFLTYKSFIAWTIILFLSRVGASFVEITTESYFFKHVDQDKTDIISFFRISRPVSFIIVPLVFALSLQFISFQYIFTIVGAFMIIGTHYSLALHDTR